LLTWSFNPLNPKMFPITKSPVFYFNSFLQQVGEVGLLFFQTFKNLFKKPWEKRIFIQQLEEIGVRSLPVVSLTAAFGGLVFGLQTYVGFHRYIGPGSETYGGPIISLGLSKELIPILVGLMVSGRVGSAMAAEIGTMKITEQIDALFSLGADPTRYLVVPRTLASIVMLPCLTIYGDIIGMAAGFFYNVYLMGVNRVLYIRNTLLYMELWDIMSGLLKSAVFGVIIALIGCWQGLRTEGGAEGVGRATTRTVVIASILILIVNFFLSKALPADL
jgi:phospholipid/cholesterol/gamma-HCH transport system permease protein